MKPSASACSRVVAYVRCSTSEQAISGLGLAAQEAACRAEVARSEQELVGIYSDTSSGSATPSERDGLSQALVLLASGGADRLLVSRLDRVSRSVLDLATLLRTASEESWTFSALDLGVDTNSPFGKTMAQVASAFAELERELIAQRTRDALQVAKERGTRLGRPSVLMESTKVRVEELRSEGLTLKTIAAVLTAEGIPTALGGRWWPSTVRQVLVTLDLDRHAAERRSVAAQGSGPLDP